MTEHAFEPELDQPTPRRIAARDGCGYGCGLWAVRLFILPHTIAGPFLLYQAGRALVIYLGVLLAGTDVDGRITQKTERPGKKGPSYSADYVYTVGETEYAARTSLTADDYAALEVGQTIPVRAWEAAPQVGNWPGVPGHHPVWNVLGLGAAALFWNGIMSIFLWFLYVEPWRQRQLVRYGVPTRGVVRAIAFCRDGKAEARRITYDYTPGPSVVFGGQRSGSVKVTPAKAAEVKVGNVLTVLYHPRRPHRSVLYRFSNYRAR